MFGVEQTTTASAQRLLATKPTRRVWFAAAVAVTACVSITVTMTSAQGAAARRGR